MRQSHTDILAHMTEHFGPVAPLAQTEIVAVTGMDIHVIVPRQDGDSLILFTTGMSDRPQTVPAAEEVFRYTELFIRLPGNWPISGSEWKDDCCFWPFRWMRQIAWHPFENDTWLGGPWSIISNDDPPIPLASNTQQSCILLLKEMGERGTVNCRDGRKISLFSMLPIYKEERDLEIAGGIKALFQAFQTHGVRFEFQADRINAATGN